MLANDVVGLMARRGGGPGRIRIAVLVLLITAMLAACGERVQPPLSFALVPLPVLPKEVIRLSVAHVVNPRLEKFSDAQLAVLLDAMRTASKVHLGREIEFDRVETFSIDEYFKEIPASRQAWRNSMIYDFKKGKGDRGKLEDAYGLAIDQQTVPARDWAAFAAREIGLEKVDTDRTAWKIRFADVHLQRLALLANLKAADGKPVIDQTPHNEWMFWNSLGERERTHDVIITNQLVASAEYGAVDIHSALRGGLTSGTTAFAPQARFGTQLWWSTFAFTSNDPVIVEMRGGEKYEPAEAARLAGIGAAHELGHLLFQYGHPFGVPACVMSPTPMLRFREQSRKLDAGACVAAQSPSMKPGVLRIIRPVYAADLKR